MSDVRAPFNRPTVLTLAGADPMRRVIPPADVRAIEEIAAGATSAGQRIRQAEIAHRASVDSRSHSAWQRGFARGHADALGRLREFLAALDTRRRALDAEIVGLVTEAVNRIVRNLPRELLTPALIECALAEAQDLRGRLTLRVNPQHASVAENWLRRRKDGGMLRIVVAADAGIDECDCVLETPAGTIDAGLRTQLAALAAVLRGSLPP